jgi:PAS domain S-box-containing protein
MDLSELAIEILNSIDDTVVIANPEGAIIFMNRPAEQLAGCVQQEVLGQPVSACLGEQVPWQELFDRVLQTGRGEEFDREFVDPRGVKRFLLIRIFPLKDPPEPTRAVGIMARDLSDLRDLEVRLIRKGEELQDHLTKTDALVSALSHDLRTPLISIQGFANLLAKKYRNRLDEKGMAYLDRLKREADRMDRLVQDLPRPNQPKSLGDLSEET